jgi:hypothetical protein
MKKVTFFLIFINLGNIFASASNYEQPRIILVDRKTGKVDERDVYALLGSNLNLGSSSSQTFNINNDSKFNAEVVQKAVVTSDVNQSQSIATLQDNYFEKNKKYLERTAEDFLSWIKNNTLQISCAALLAYYSYLLYQIYVAHQIIFNPSSWSNWQGDRSLEELFAVPQSKLEAELLYVFQNRHIDLHNPTDFIYSLVQSSLSLEREIYIVHQQITRYESIAACCFTLTYRTPCNSLNADEPNLNAQ